MESQKKTHHYLVNQTTNSECDIFVTFFFALYFVVSYLGTLKKNFSFLGYKFNENKILFENKDVEVTCTL